jgi:arsenate reductase
VSTDAKKTILFICTHNSARSQIAEALVNELVVDRYKAFSAGSEPTRVNPYAITAMAEIGIDISANQAKIVNVFRGKNFDYVVTVCDHAKEACPFFPGAKQYLHQGFTDPSTFTGSDEEKLSGFRRVRDEIKSWIESTFGQEDYRD